ncbi:hypothetical protein AB0280_15540 [Pseudarthrobacter sp902506025]|uniref:hypothetical protein n=1 Tax=Pseudarthrobacter sp. 902506025 TaxID=3155291 RepID=UPI00344E6038
MGVTNVDSLLENHAVSTLRDAAQLMNERKAMQRVGGSSVRYFRTDSPGAWLWTGQIDTVPAAAGSFSGLARFLVILTSGTSVALMSSCVVEVEGSTDGVTWVSLPAATGPGAGNWTLQDAGVINAEPYKSKYELRLDGPYNEYRRFKVQALSSDPVAISTTRIL